ncbi:MAG: L,D-transpeptidase [Rhizobiaceae bacterium]
MGTHNMISRRFFATALAALAGTALTGPSQARSLLYLFGEPDPVVIRRPRKLPEPVSLRKPKKKQKQIAAKTKPKKKKSGSSKPFQVDPVYLPQEVAFFGPQQPGDIVVKSSERFLYLVQPGGTARRYGIAIGKEGLGWTGSATIKAKVEWPSWTPTPDMLKRDPKKYGPHKDGMPGGPGNPLGARAMYLYQGKRDTSIRIHGTTQPWSIGKAASNGCFRMVNEHVIDLFNRVRIGTKVIVI